MQRSAKTRQAADARFRSRVEEKERLERQRADLFAAAHDLLAACEAALESVTVMQTVFHPGSVARGCFDGAFIGVEKALRAAIRKARGER